MEELMKRLDAQEGQIAALREAVFLLARTLAQRDERGASWAADRLGSARLTARTRDGVEISADAASILDGVERRLQGRAI